MASRAVHTEEIMPVPPMRVGHRARVALSVRRPTRTALGAALATVVALGASLAGTSSSDARSIATVTPEARIQGAPLALDQFQWFVGLTSDGHNLYAADRGRIVKIATGPARSVAAYDASALAPWLVRTPHSQAGIGSAVMAANDHAVFTTDGTTIVRIGADLDGSGIVKYGTKGAGQGQFSNITGLAAFGDWLYAADAGNHRVVRLPQTLDGSDWRAYGSAGTGVGRFDRLAGMAATFLSVFVVDAGTDRIIRMSPELDGSGWTELYRRDAGMFGALVAKGGDLYTRATDCTADILQGVLRVPQTLTAASVACQRLPPTDGSVAPKSFATDIAVLPDGTYMGVDAYDTGVIELRRLYADSPTVADAYGTPAYGSLGQFASPLGSAVSGDTLFVCDRASTAPLAATRIVAIRRSDRTFIAQVAAPCSASRLAADGEYVFGADDATVYRFRALDLEPAGEYGRDGTGIGRFGRIDALAAARGTVYAVDGALGRVARFSGVTFDGTGWKAVAGPGRVGAGRTVAGVDPVTLAVALETPKGVTVSRIATTLAGTWKTQALSSGGRAVTDVGGLDVEAGRVYVTTQMVGGRRGVSVIVLDAKTLATLGIGVNRLGAPAKLVTPNGVAATKGGLFVADAGADVKTPGGRPSGGITVWAVGSTQ
jgi:hypothetical protein